MINRTCIDCSQWQWENAEPDWSEITPGAEWRSFCRAGVWYLSGCDGATESDWRRHLKMAATCSKFTPLPQ